MTQKRQIANMYKAHMASVDLDPKNREHNALVAKETGIDPEQLQRIRSEGVTSFHQEDADRLDTFFDARRADLGRRAQVRSFTSLFKKGEIEITSGKRPITPGEKKIEPKAAGRSLRFVAVKRAPGRSSDDGSDGPER